MGGTSEGLTSDDFRDFELGGWNTVADAYREHFQRLTEQSVAPLLDAAQVGADVAVLDVACGPGHVSAAAARRGARVVGVDFSAAQVALAARTYPHVEFQAGDALDLPFADATFDAVVMNFGLSHFPDPVAALAQAHRVLRPGARCAATWWATPDKAVGFGAVLDAVKTHGDLNVPLPEGPAFFSLSEPRALREAFHDAGFAASVEIDELPLLWQQKTATSIYECVLEGSVRTRALLVAQAPAAAASIKRAIGTAFSAYQGSDGYLLPMTCLLAAARKA